MSEEVTKKHHGTTSSRRNPVKLSKGKSLNTPSDIEEKITSSISEDYKDFLLEINYGNQLNHKGLISATKTIISMRKDMYKDEKERDDNLEKFNNEIELFLDKNNILPDIKFIDNRVKAGEFMDIISKYVRTSIYIKSEKTEGEKCINCDEIIEGNSEQSEGYCVCHECGAINIRVSPLSSNYPKSENMPIDPIQNHEKFLNKIFVTSLCVNEETINKIRKFYETSSNISVEIKNMINNYKEIPKSERKRLRKIVRDIIEDSKNGNEVENLNEILHRCFGWPLPEKGEIYHDAKLMDKNFLTFWSEKKHLFSKTNTPSVHFRLFCELKTLDFDCALEDFTIRRMSDESLRQHKIIWSAFCNEKSIRDIFTLRENSSKETPEESPDVMISDVTSKVISHPVADTRKMVKRNIPQKKSLIKISKN